MFKTKFSKRQLLEAGIVLVIILLIIGYITKNNIWVGISIAMLFLNLIFSTIFYPVALIWFNFSEISGTIVSKIVLGIIYCFIVVPVGVIRKLLGKDSLLLKKFKTDNSSVLKIRNYTYKADDFDKPF